MFNIQKYTKPICVILYGFGTVMTLAPNNINLLVLQQRWSVFTARYELDL